MERMKRKNMANNDGMGRTDLAKRDAGLEGTNYDIQGQAVAEDEVNQPEVQEKVEKGVQEMAEKKAEADLPEKLKQAEAKAKEYLDLAKRARAELINFRRRVEREKEDFRRYAIEELIRDLFPLIDILDSALSTFEGKSDTDKQLLDGLGKFSREFERVLENHGVKIYGSAGDRYDPHLYEAIETHESEEVEYETVSKVYQRGVQLADRLLRAAKVSVLVPKSSDLGEERKAGIEDKEGKGEAKKESEGEGKEIKGGGEGDSGA